MTVSTIKSDEARNTWAALLDRVLGNQSEEIIIERYSRPLAVLVNHASWDRLKKAHAALLRSRSTEMDSDPSTTIPWDSVKEEMKERGLLDA
jgi:prevent-host-death family protein